MDSDEPDLFAELGFELPEALVKRLREGVDELMKPFALNVHQLEVGPRLNLPLRKALSTPQASDHPLARYFPERFDLYALQDWKSLAGAFRSAGLDGHALRALENAHAIAKVHPTYGLPGAGDRDRPDNWVTMCELYDLMAEVATGGDLFDQKVVAVQVRQKAKWVNPPAG